MKVAVRSTQLIQLNDLVRRTADQSAVLGPTMIAACYFPKTDFARKPSYPLVCSSPTIARPIAIVSATAASIF